MTRKTAAALVLTLTLALAGTTGAMAQDEEASFDPASIPEMNQDEALILFQQWRENMLAAGVAAEDLPAAAAYFEDQLANMSEADVDELLAGQMLAESDAEMGDDEFGQSEEDEPEIGDDDMGGEDDDEEDESE